MLSVIGTVLKKPKKNNNNNADLVVKDNDENIFSFHVQRGKLQKLAFVEIKYNVEVIYRNDMKEKKNGKGMYYRINNLILIDLKVL